LLEAAAVFATFAHFNHLVCTAFAYAHGDLLTCHLPAMPSHLGIVRVFSLLIMQGKNSERKLWTKQNEKLWRRSHRAVKEGGEAKSSKRNKSNECSGTDT
ncbi:MAG: hypothetical protein ACRCT2_16475, partial [Plesiomonas shigelloides]